MGKTNVSVKASLTVTACFSSPVKKKKADGKNLTWLVLRIIDGINIEEFLVRRGF